MRAFFRSAGVLSALALAGVACASATRPQPEPGAPPGVPPGVTAAATASSGTSAAPAAPSAAPATRVQTDSVSGETGRPCGALDCRSFASPRAAFEYAVRDAPRVIAVGESHAQKAAARVTSATERFRQELLPSLAGRAKGIVIELLLPDRRCRKEEVKAVAKRQEAVTEPQADSNQNEFVVLGKTARKLGIVPQPLVPSCEELGAVLGAGAGDIDAMLKLIANITVRETAALLEQGDPNKAVVSYGGLVHNDRVPRPGREAWSFGPRVAEKAGGRFVEIDLIVPEFLRSEPPWTNLPWYPHYDATRDGAETRLFQPTPGSFVLVFPRSPNEKALK